MTDFSNREFDFSLMDYDTYSVIIGGTYEEYLDWHNSLISIPTIEESQPEITIPEEENIQPFYDNLEEVKLNKEQIEKEAYLRMLVIYLEMMAYHYGLQEITEDYQKADLQQQLERLFSFYKKVGFDKQEVMDLLKDYLTGNRKRNRKR